MPRNPRKCIATGAEIGERTAAFRYVRAPDGTLAPDLAGKLPGRGAWVLAHREAVSNAVQKGLFSRAFQAETKRPEEQSVEDHLKWLEVQLTKRALSALGLVRRSGKLVVGFDQVQGALKKGGVSYYIHATDAAIDGRDKLISLLQAKMAADGIGVGIVSQFSNEALSEATGLGNAIHLAIPSGAAHGFRREISRLSGILSGIASDN